MKQANKRLGVWVDAGQIGTLVGVASITGKRQARRIGGTAVLFGYDMFEVEGDKGSCGLRQPAVLAGVPGPAANQISSSLIQLKRPAATGTAEPSPALWRRGQRLR